MQVPFNSVPYKKGQVPNVKLFVRDKLQDS